MRTLRLLIPLLLVAAALTLHAPGLSADPGPLASLFEQGAFRPLIQAELALARGDIGAAIDSFGACALRASRCGEAGLLDRVRMRLASAGLERGPSNPSLGWPLLARYALWSDRFSLEAERIEGFMLTERPGMRSFRYDMIEASGDKTIWGRSPIRVPIWLISTLPSRWRDGFASATYNMTPAGVPAGIESVRILKLEDTGPAPSIPWQLDLSVPPEGKSTWYASVNNLVRWDAPVLSPGQAAALVPVPREGFFSVDRLLEVDRARDFKVQAALVHIYAPLKVKVS